MEEFDYQYFVKAADYVKSVIHDTPEIAIILGSCLGDFASRIQNPVVISYVDIPNFPVTTVKSHAGKLIFGTVMGKKVICMSGRFHHYEGYSFARLAFPIRLFKLLGVKATVISNASGAVNADYRVGDIAVITDHIKLTSLSPLAGKNIDEFGPRFFDTTKMYTPELRSLALKIADENGMKVHESVYMYFGGPQFETPAEIRAAKILGADLIGMSTITEALTAAHCSMPLLALAVVTNMAAGVTNNEITVDEVNETTEKIAQMFGDYVENIIKGM